VLDVKKTLIAALLAGVLSVVLATGGQVFCAENRAPNAPAPTVFVLLDVIKLQKENPRLKLGLERLNEERQAIGVDLKKQEDALKEMYAQLKQMKAGTRDYDDLDRRIMSKAADLQAQAAMRQKELAKKEAKLHYSVFQDIQEEVDRFAARNQIAAVLRFNSDQPDLENPEDIRRDLATKQIVWYEASLDITPDIRKALATRYERQQPTGARPSFPAPQQR
jgi:Skp family chaperone for outer membrane proteins